MSRFPRILIVLAAMIAGGYVAGEIADRFYLPNAGPGERGMAAAQMTIVVIIPEAATLAGIIAFVLTRTRNSRPM
jgi:hypothetical protein